jgi:hypothetical protein
MHLDKQTFEKVCQNGPKDLRSFRHPE